MSNLLDIQLQIQKLQKQEAEIREREFDKTVQDIRAKMQAFGITVKDLQAATAVVGRKRRGRQAATPVAKESSAKKRKTGTPVAPKYRGPNGELWSGRGLTPKWMAVLLEAGQQKEDFAISD